ncbi:restriction endonuclease [Myroides pelagicus]|uniref:Restriction endonuclease type IV Mrr domain-containing protein n=1 Tax=Myroides pelagicus TaxID=270914 RepID=A0A7K1GND4_9FLAO|nr:restriction endonuclease [Myroides pelagicus]MTH30328.1 hypothetical protein [Myroides pelagicus]
MGSIVWNLENCVNTILDIIVIKTGIVISEDYLIEILNHDFPNSYFENYSIRKNNAVRIRSEKFDEICWSVRKRLGELEKNSPLFIQNIDKILVWEEQGICYSSLCRKILQMMSDIYNPNNPQFIDPKPIIDQLVSENEYPIEVIVEAFKDILHNQTMSNTIKPVEEILWDGGISLSDLFEKEHIPLKEDEFIDQKFINYLQANPEKLQYMHWRNFERLTAEYFNRQDFEIELGPGSNDGGIDIRVYNTTNKEKPYIIIQCKRHKESHEVKIETVKAFYADLLFEDAEKGLIATTSKIATGGKKAISIRKYPLNYAENKEITDWVNKMSKR